MGVYKKLLFSFVYRFSSFCRSTIRANSPPRAISSAGVPCSATVPSLSTTILWALATVFAYGVRLSTHSMTGIYKTNALQPIRCNLSHDLYLLCHNSYGTHIFFVLLEYFTHIQDYLTFFAVCENIEGYFQTTPQTLIA